MPCRDVISFQSCYVSNIINDIIMKNYINKNNSDSKYQINTQVKLFDLCTLNLRFLFRLFKKMK